MKLWRTLPLLTVAVSCLAAEVPKIAPAEAARQVREGQAVLVDVREPREWAETGVAAPAVLLPKSDFDHGEAAWKPFLAAHAHKHLILYCRTGRRAGVVAAALAARGFAVENAGGFKDWTAAGLPVRPVAAPSAPSPATPKSPGPQR